MRTSRYLVLALAVWSAACSPKEPTLFERLEASQTGVAFENRLQESEQWNILAYEYFYNGGGVAVGDFNNDSLPDIYFTGNQVPNRLYLNRGSFEFEDITDKAGVGGRKDGWATGVTLADVNADGYLDLYVCYSGPLPADQRKNQLFINNGNLTFTERAEAYGLAEAGYSTQAAFLDYDRDGDLDLFVMNHNLRNYGRKEAAFLKASRDPDAGDKLYRNDGGRFVEVGEQAGILSNPLGFGLGLAVADLNQDGWPDLYVGNDYVEEDYVYLNNRDDGRRDGPSFTERGKQMMGHYSFSTMGCDIADVNNDTRPDVFTMDMLPADNARQKLLAWPDSWNVQISMLENGFHWQNMRNMLQLNTGNDASGLPLFSEVGQLAGVAHTDWSWGSLFADFDNDGFKDLFVSNGYVRDYTNLDFIKYYADEKMKAEGNGSLLKHLEKMPSTPTRNYIFRNEGGLEGNFTFTDKVQEWGFDRTTVACGSAYADLDGDGDLDLITNNTNEPAGLYRNNQQERAPQAFLKVDFTSSSALGAKALVYTGGTVQMQEYYPTRGFQSASATPLHFGLGATTQLDSVRVLWPDGQSQLLTKVPVNQTLYPDKSKAAPYGGTVVPDPAPLLEEVPGLNFTHRENFVIDFNHQILLPRQYSYEGPRLAKADLNGDGLEDFFVGGATGQPGGIFLQKPDNSFQLVNQPALVADSAYEYRAAVFLDADGDGDQDLYVVSGAYERQPFDPAQEDRLYFNDGRGHFTPAPVGSLPGIRRSGSCVVALDVDKDGDTDLFVGGGVSPGEFPYAAESFLLKNDGKGRFSLASDPLPLLGMLTDVSAADINQDGWPDLVVVGEWMPVTYFINQRGTFDFTQKQLVEGSEGLWLRLAAADLDGDGDTDFVAGNWGLNNSFGVSATAPLTLYANDFDRNGTIDPFMTYYIQDKEYPLASRDEALEQLLPLRKRFTDYGSYAKATFSEVLTETELKSAEIRKVTELQTSLLINEGGKLVLRPLPHAVQQAPVSAIVVDDFNQDGHMDLLVAGNLSKTRIRIGKMDASYGLVLLGDGQRGFTPLPMNQSGVRITGDTKDILKVGEQWVVARNNAPLLLIKQQQRVGTDKPLIVNK